MSSKYNPRYDEIDLLSEELEHLAQIARDEDDELCAIKLMSDDEREDAYQAARLPMVAATNWARSQGLKEVA